MLTLSSALKAVSMFEDRFLSVLQYAINLNLSPSGVGVGFLKYAILSHHSIAAIAIPSSYGL